MCFPAPPSLHSPVVPLFPSVLWEVVLVQQCLYCFCNGSTDTTLQVFHLSHTRDGLKELPPKTGVLVLHRSSHEEPINVLLSARRLYDFPLVVEVSEVKPRHAWEIGVGSTRDEQVEQLLNVGSEQVAQLGILQRQTEAGSRGIDGLLTCFSSLMKRGTFQRASSWMNIFLKSASFGSFQSLKTVWSLSNCLSLPTFCLARFLTTTCKQVRL